MATWQSLTEWLFCSASDWLSASASCSSSSSFNSWSVLRTGVWIKLRQIHNLLLLTIGSRWRNWHLNSLAIAVPTNCSDILRANRSVHRWHAYVVHWLPLFATMCSTHRIHGPPSRCRISARCTSSPSIGRKRFGHSCDSGVCAT